MDNKTQIIEALRVFTNNRPEIVAVDYDGFSAYRKALAEAAVYRKDALKMIRSIELMGVDYAAIRVGFLANDNRLECALIDGSVRLEFTAGQNYATEFRSAVCVVCARALWNHWAARKPIPAGPPELPLYEGRTLRCWIAEQARQELGASIATRWFN